MKLRVPLYAKILVWFFLNVIVLGISFLVFAVIQFNFGLDVLVSGPAAERLQSVVQELNESPRDHWHDVLKKYDEAYPAKFYLFRNDIANPEQVAGDPVSIPPKVRSHMIEHRPAGAPPGGGPGRRGGPGGGFNPEGLQQEPPQGGEPPMGGGQRPADGPQPPPRAGQPPPGLQGPPQRFMVHTSAPSRYWVLVPFRLRGLDPERPFLPAVLVIESETLSAGGLFLDWKPWLIAGACVVVISALFWFPLVRSITSSISQMTEATESIAEGQFDVRTRVHRGDELGSLSEAINRMGTRLSGFVSGQKRFLGDIAHELCSPVARMQIALGILEHRLGEAEKERVEDLREEVEHMSELVNELLSFSRAALGKSNLRLQPVLLRGLIERAVARECAPGDAEVKLDIPADLRVTAEPDLLLRGLANVLRNAIRYAAQAGPITISTARADDMVTLTVEDCGPGIPPEAIAQVFDPFYRVDTSRARETGGVGLGLAIVKTCVESCGGTVRCENRSPTGLRVIIQLRPVN